MAPAVVGDDTVAVVEEEEQLGVPVVRAQRPAVVEHDRPARTPVLVEDLGAVPGGDVRLVRSSWSRQPAVRGAPLLAGGTVDHRGPDQRVPEAHRTAVLRHHDQVVALRGSERVEPARPARPPRNAECRRSPREPRAAVPRAFCAAAARRGRCTERATSRPWPLAHPAALAVPAAGCPGGPGELKQSRGFPCASCAKAERTRRGRWAKRRESSRRASASSRGAIWSSGRPVDPADVSGSSRWAPSSPRRRPPSLLATKPNAARLARSTAWRSSTTRSNGRSSRPRRTGTVPR
ncbi:hypothetical protein SFUMM280S_08181 [Streptomyces fumanus]